jgi:hypothetical protein
MVGSVAVQAVTFYLVAVVAAAFKSQLYSYRSLQNYDSQMLVNVLFIFFYEMGTADASIIFNS